MTSAMGAWLAALVLAASSGGAPPTSPEATPAPRWSPGEPIPSLARAYRGQFLVGAAVSSDTIRAGAEFVKRQFDVVVAESEMKPPALSKQLGAYDFAAADALVGWAAANGIKVRGHCLVWYQQEVPGMFDAGGARVSRDELVERLRAYIHAVVGHFKGRVWAWDVVNEAFVPGDPGGDRGWRRSGWYDVLGPEFIALAFRFAHEADPDALLFYNDYETEVPAKRAMILELIRSLREKGVPIHGVGHQCHYTVARPDPAELEVTIQEVARLGLRNHITEMDLSLRERLGAPVPPLTDELRERQARRWAEFFRMFRRNRDKIDAVLLWGVNDEASWLGSPDEPLLFKAFQPTQAFWAVLGAAR